jgi:hypothetical protein
LRSIRSPLALNIAKSKIDSLDSIRQHGIELLGTAVGSKDYRLAFLNEKIDEQRKILDTLLTVSSQSGLLLHRNCVQQNLRHLQRSLKTADLPGC